MKKIFIITGEYSADMHASLIVNELKKIMPDVIIEGVGESNLEKAGVKLFCNHEKMGQVKKKLTREDSNAATFGLWMDMGAIIKEHFTIGGYFNFVLTNLVKKEYWKVGNVTDGYYAANLWSPNFSFGISLGWQFNPVKLYKIKKK